jgi:hypothetical protein
VSLAYILSQIKKVFNINIPVKDIDIDNFFNVKDIKIVNNMINKDKIDAKYIRLFHIHVVFFFLIHESVIVIII